MKRVAGVDCGTNSIRLIVADIDTSSGRPTLVDRVRDMRIVRLGQGVDRTGEFNPDAIGRTLEATRAYKDVIDREGASAVRFVATSATRDARNRDVFISGVRDILGVEPEVIPGTEEASLSFRGAASALPAGSPMPVMVVDIGGGSTELVIGRGDVDQAVSINMGSVRVTEKFVHEDPAGRVTPAEQARARAWIDEQLDQAETSIDISQVRTLVGVAGTVTTLSAQALGLDRYRPEMTHSAVLSFQQAQAAIDFMTDQPVAVKAGLGFMPQGRADVIGAGALVWERIIRRVELRSRQAGHPIDSFVTSEHDILDGIALSLAG